MTMLQIPPSLRGRVARVSTPVLVATLCLAVSAVPEARAASAYSSDATQPDLVSLLADYSNYWKASNAYDSTDSSTFGKGEVVNADVLRHDDETTVRINNAAAAGSDGTTPTAQQKRALIDSDYKMDETLPDSLGTILGSYFSEGLKQGKLPLTDELLIASGTSLISNYLDTGDAKSTYNHPRPFVDRTNAGYVKAGLSKTLSIDRVPKWTDEDGTEHYAGYEDWFLTSPSFPSGHTTYAYSGGIGLATLIPELAPEILARASEAGNNRIVLGVHYPLDIMGGRIDGEAANVARWSDTAFRTDKILPAQKELRAYLTSRCKADGYGDTLAACIDKTGANDKNGYSNSFTDVVATVAVTDRASALTVYKERLTYGFSQTGKSGQKAVVPEGAENLLITTFPTLSASQRRTVLADTEIDSGYPLDSSSEGYQRLNLAAAMSSKVTLSADGSVVKVEPGQKVASVVVEKSSSSDSSKDSSTSASTTGTQSKNGSSSASTTTKSTTKSKGSASTSSPSTTSSALASTGAGAGMAIVLATTLLATGFVATFLSRRHRAGGVTPSAR